MSKKFICGTSIVPLGGKLGMSEGDCFSIITMVSFILLYTMRDMCDKETCFVVMETMGIEKKKF